MILFFALLLFVLLKQFYLLVCQRYDIQIIEPKKKFNYKISYKEVLNKSWGVGVLCTFSISFLFFLLKSAYDSYDLLHKSLRFEPNNTMLYNTGSFAIHICIYNYIYIFFNKAKFFLLLRVV